MLTHELTAGSQSVFHPRMKTNGPQIKIKQRDRDTRQRWWWRKGCNLYNWLFVQALHSGTSTFNQPPLRLRLNNKQLQLWLHMSTLWKAMWLLLEKHSILQSHTSLLDLHLWSVNVSLVKTSLHRAPLCKHQKVLSLSFFLPLAYELVYSVCRNLLAFSLSTLFFRWVTV